MASSYSNVLGLELIGPGEQSGTWGVTTNTNLGTLLEQAITGVETITMTTTDSTLIASQGIINQARNAVIVIGGTPDAGRAIIIPQKEKVYIFTNTTTNAVLITTYTRVYPTPPTQFISVPAGASLVTYCDGTNVVAVNPFSASPITVTVFTGYISTNQLTVSAVSQGTIAIGQTLYVPFGTSGFTAGTTITAGSTSPYTVSASQTVGTATNLVTFVALATPNQIATVDYVQNKSKSVYLGGIPTADTATSTIGQAYITGTKLVVTAAPVSGFAINQFVYGKGIAANTQITTTGLVNNGNVAIPSGTFTGYISGTSLYVPTGTGSEAVGQLITGGSINETAGVTIQAFSSTSGGFDIYTLSASLGTVGSATSLVSFNGWGTGTTGTGYYIIGGSAQTVATTTVVTALQQYQIANTSFAAGIVNGLGTMASQSSNAVSISGGAISNVTLSNLASTIGVSSGGTGQTSLNPNSVVTGGSTSTGAVATVRPDTLGNVLASTAGSTITVSSATMVLGVQYTIVSLGTTTTQANWNTIAGTSGLTYAVGSVFTCANIGTGLGDGTIATTNWTSAPVSTLIPAGSIGPTQLSGQQTGSFPVYGVRAFAYIDWNRGTVAANALVTGQQYVIQDAGTSVNWVAMGASLGAFGTVFTKNSTAYSGTGGTAYALVSRGFSQIFYSVNYSRVRFTFEGGSYPSQYQYAIASTVGNVGSQLYATEYSRDATGFSLQTSDDPSVNNVSQMSVMVIY